MSRQLFISLRAAAAAVAVVAVVVRVVAAAVAAADFPPMKWRAEGAPVFGLSILPYSEQFQSNFRAISEQFQSSFKDNFGAI